MIIEYCDRCGQSIDEGLIVTAAGSLHEPEKKLEILMARNISIAAVSPNSGENILHQAVLSANLPVLKLALEKGVSQIPNNNGDLPIHIAASSVGTVESLALLARPDLRDVQNQTKATPLSLAVRSGSREKVELLLQCGCMPLKSKMLKYVPVKSLSILTIPTVIGQSPQPLMFSLQMSTTILKASKFQELQGEDCLAKANQMITMATEIVDRSKIFPSGDVINYAINKKIKKVSNPNCIYNIVLCLILLL